MDFTNTAESGIFTSMNSVIERDELSSLIQYTDLYGSDNQEFSLDHSDAILIAEDILDAYLIIRKDTLPEAKVEGTMIYAGNQAVSKNSKVDDLMDKALSYLSAATMVHVLDEERKQMEKEEQNEILSVFNSFAKDKKVQWSELSDNEKLLGKELVRLRNLKSSFM